jgi:SAM-dependent methyltransferase
MSSVLNSETNLFSPGTTISEDRTIENVAEFWDHRPCNIKHSKSECGTKQYFDEVEIRKYYVEPHIKKFADFAKWHGKRVLEIGCGIGTDAINFVRAGAIYTGLELSKISLEITKKRFSVYGLQPEALLEGNAEELDKIFTIITDLSKQFDLIYSFGVIHHTPQPRYVIEQIAKLNLLKQKIGELRIMVYAARSWKAAMIEAGLDQPEAQDGCPIAYTYTNESVHKLMADLFNIKSIQQDHIFPYIVEKYKNYEYELQPYFKAMPNDVFNALEKTLGWHLLIIATKE